MRIGIDIDEVLVDFLTPFLEDHNARYGTAYSSKTFHSFGMHHVMDEDQATIVARIEAFFKTDTYKNLQPIPGAEEAVSELAKNHVLLAISSRNDSIRDFTRQWIKLHFPGITEVHFSNHPYVSREAVHSKAELCLLLKLDVLIEDAFEHVLPCAEKGIKVLLFDTPWNQMADLPANITRVHSWPEIVDVIRQNQI